MLWSPSHKATTLPYRQGADAVPRLAFGISRSPSWNGFLHPQGQKCQGESSACG